MATVDGAMQHAQEPLARTYQVFLPLSTAAFIFALGPFMLAFKDPEMQGFWDILDDLWGQAEPIDTDPYVDSESPGPVLAIQDLTVEEETGPLLAVEDITEPGPDQHSHVA